MTVIKHICISLLTIIVLYVVGMLALKNIKYNGKPIIYITNDYYNWKGGDTYQKYQEFKLNQSKNDVVFVGSSRAYRGYSPFIFELSGYKSFNLGTSAQSIKNTYFVIKHYINASNCKLLVVDVFAGAFTKNQLESSSDLIENIEEPKAAYDIAIHNNDIRTINIAALRYLTENDSTYFKKTDYLGKGFSINTDSMSLLKQKQFYGKVKLSHKKIEIDEDQIKYFNQIIELCKNRNVKLVFVYSPVSYFYNYDLHKPFVNLIAPVLQKNNIKFYDFSKCDSINTAYHFYDDSHLNQAGVQIFNNQLINQLIKDNLLYKNGSN